MGMLARVARVPLFMVVLAMVAVVATSARDNTASAAAAGDEGTCSSPGCEDPSAKAAGAEDRYHEAKQDPFASYPHQDMNEDWNKRGIREAQAGNFNKALEYFRAASHHSPFRGDVWSNIGHAILDSAKVSRKPMHHRDHLPLLREAMAAFSLGSLLGNKPAQRYLENLHHDLRNWHPQDYRGATKAARRLARIEEEAIQHMREEDNIAAANSLCKHKQDLYVTLSEQDRSGPLSPVTARRIFLLLRVCGVVALKDIMDPTIINRIHDSYKADFADFLSDLDTRQSSAAMEWTDAAERSTDRYEVKFPLRAPYTDTDFTGNRFILATAKMLTTDKIEIDTFSTVTSLPHAPVQQWHADVGPLFHRQAPTHHLPPMGLVVVLPLVPMNATNGPTEFMTGSHVAMGVDYWKNRLSDPTTPVHRLEADVGSAVIFDLRVYHRGTGNPSNVARPIVYMSFVYDWYSDVVNFKARQTKDFDGYEGSLKKLFARLDTQNYIQKLEQLLEEKGVDVAALSSAYDYKQVELKA